jgi:hypothetical protein
LAALSGGSGTTKAALVPKILRRIGDRPSEDIHTNAPTGSGTSLTVASNAQQKFQIGGWIDWVDDGTLDQAIITDIPNTTTLTIRRGYRGATAASHSANAVFRYRARVEPQAASEIIDDVIQSLWPEIYLISETSYTPAATPKYWYDLPADCEKVLQVYQQIDVTGSNPVDIVDFKFFDGPDWKDTTLVSTSGKGLWVPNVSTQSDDSKLHVIYIGKCSLTNLTDAQIQVVLYETCASLMATQFAGESKPERRSGLEGAPDSGNAFKFFKAAAQDMRQREAQRLREFMPRRDKPRFIGSKKHSSEG